MIEGTRRQPLQVTRGKTKAQSSFQLQVTSLEVTLQPEGLQLIVVLPRHVGVADKGQRDPSRRTPAQRAHWARGIGAINSWWGCHSAPLPPG